MTSELDQFLADLGGRRERLLQLVQPEDAGQAALLDELTELGEQLIIAEEELRVQQEELSAAAALAQHLLQEREELRSSSARPYLLTDRRGVVLRANPAAERLIRPPSIRTTPRPIATWFDVPDRPAIRTMISRVTAGQESLAQTRAVIRRADRTTVPVLVTVSVAAGSDGQIELQWELCSEHTEPAAALPPSDRPAKLQVVPAPESATERELASELSALAVELAGCDSEQQLLAVGAERARQLIPGAGHAGVLLLGRRGALHSDASGDELVQACDQLQLTLGQGPAFTALTERGPVLVTDTAAEPRWPAFAAAAAGLGIRSILSIDLAAGDIMLGTLSVYAEQPGAFGEQAGFVTSTLAIQLGLALEHLRTVRNLRAGMANRALIGEAIGVLVERRRITSRQAFQLLVQASQHNNVKLHNIARIVSETGQDPTQLRFR
jgi:PAS domain-containing protein